MNWSVISIAVIFYLLPTVIAFGRNKTKKATIAITNIFLGWTIIFWIIAIFMCFDSHEAIDESQHIEYEELEDSNQIQEGKSGIWVNRYVNNIIHWHK